MLKRGKWLKIHEELSGQLDLLMVAHLILFVFGLIIWAGQELAWKKAQAEINAPQ